MVENQQTDTNHHLKSEYSSPADKLQNRKLLSHFYVHLEKHIAPGECCYARPFLTRNRPNLNTELEPRNNPLHISFHSS
jgi:hypothetical protein